MKKIFKVNWDGIYTSIDEVELNSEVAKSYLIDFDYEYYKSFGLAKKEVLRYMKNQLNDWKYAAKRVGELKKVIYYND